MTVFSSRASKVAERMLATVAIPVAVILLASACSSSKSSTPAGGGTSATTSSSSSVSSGASSSGTSSSGTSSAGAMVDVKNFAFSPMDLTVAVGAKVTWKFDDSAGHTVKSSDGTFSSPTLSNGKTFDFTFTKPGTYSYICSIHQYMAGTITVK